MIIYDFLTRTWHRSIDRDGSLIGFVKSSINQINPMMIVGISLIANGVPGKAIPLPMSNGGSLHTIFVEVAGPEDI